MRLSLTLGALALAVPGLSGANELMKVYDLARQNDKTFQAAVHAHDASVEARPKARSALLPQVSAGYDFTREGSRYDRDEFNVLSTNPTDPSQDIRRPEYYTNKGFNVTLHQSIIDWSAITRYRQSSDLVALAETQLVDAQQQLALRVAQGYFDVLAAADTLRSSNAQNTAVGRQLEQGRKRFEVGLSAITDVQEAQASYDRTVAQQIADQQALDSARQGLMVITGVQDNPIVPLQDDIPLPSPDPTRVTDWIAAARDGNPQLLGAKLVADSADRDVEIAWAAHLPTLGLQLQYQDATLGQLFDVGQSRESATLQLRVPIFSGLGTQSDVRRYTATREQRLAEYEGTQRGVERTVRDAYQGVIAGAARVKALKQAVLSSTTALEASETGLQVGARTQVDVLAAQQSLYAAQRDYFKSRYDYLLAVLRLKAAAGRLNIQDLAELDRLLINGPAVPPAPMPPAQPTPG
jgi:outer membrane protein